MSSGSPNSTWPRCVTAARMSASSDRRPRVRQTRFARLLTLRDPPCRRSRSRVRRRARKPPFQIGERPDEFGRLERAVALADVDLPQDLRLDERSIASLVAWYVRPISSGRTAHGHDRCPGSPPTNRSAADFARTFPRRRANGSAARRRASRISPRLQSPGDNAVANSATHWFTPENAASDVGIPM